MVHVGCAQMAVWGFDSIEAMLLLKFPHAFSHCFTVVRFGLLVRAVCLPDAYFPSKFRVSFLGRIFVSRDLFQICLACLFRLCCCHNFFVMRFYS